MRFPSLKRLPLLASVILLGGCASPGGGEASSAPPDPGVLRYASLVLAMDNSGQAALFAPDAELDSPGLQPVQGQQAMNELLSGLNGYRVIESNDTPTGRTTQNDTSVQEGTFRQRVSTPDGRVVEVNGRFRLEWIRDQAGEWLIHRISTFPPG
jgi:ketosteroid isomerase-like protein